MTAHADASLKRPLNQLPIFNALVVEDDEITSRLLRLMLDRRCGALVKTVASAEEAYAFLNMEIKWDAIFIDIGLPRASGLDLLAVSKRSRPDVPHIIVTGRDTESDLAAALRAGADDYLVKPVPTASLVLAVERALTKTPPQARRQVST